MSNEQFMLFQTLYTKPCLLEACIPAENLEGPITIEDPDNLKMLGGKKGIKVAKKLAPLVVHNLLALSDDQGRELQNLLEKQESKLTESSPAWSKAYQDAVRHGVRPSQWIFKLSKAEQLSISRESKAWRGAHQSIEKVLGEWIVENREKVEAVLRGIGGSFYSVSVKKMSKAVPSI